jgi:hypothetical protein
MEIEHEKKPVSRKRFVFWTISVLSILTTARFFFRSHPKQNATTVKMLTRDGRLVEVEVTKLSPKRKKIKDADIHTWVQRKSSL